MQRARDSRLRGIHKQHLMIQKIAHFSQQIQSHLSTISYGQEPSELYEPIRYIMGLGGKRLRPTLTLMAYALFKDDPESIMDQACAVEVFHNFTLMHDDIMDRAPIRRGQATVHEKWNDSVAILSGDVMLVKAYELLLSSEDHQAKVLMQAFNKCAREVCEGQQYDMNFEAQNDVSEAAYLEMIRLKTAVLLGFSLELGALLAGAEPAACETLRNFGVNIGIGFQLKDDLLDVYADKAKFGKQVGGDIISNKKTFLLIKALEKAQGASQEELQHWLAVTEFDKAEKVQKVTAIYDQCGIKDLTEEKMTTYFDEGLRLLKKLDVPLAKKAALRDFTQELIQRER